MKHPALIVLKALLNGFTVKDGDHNLICSENNEIGVKINDDQMITVDYTLNGFIKFCEKLPEAQIIELVYQLGMNENGH